MTHSSAAGANHCSLLPKHSDNDRQSGGFSCVEMLNLTQAHTAHVETHMVADGEWKEKEVLGTEFVRKNRYTSVLCVLPLGEEAGCLYSQRWKSVSGEVIYQQQLYLSFMALSIITPKH